MTKFTVNGDEHEWPVVTIMYDEVVKLAGLTGSPTIMYKSPRNGDTYRSGCLHRGLLLNNIDGLRFTVCHTGNA